MPARRLDGAAVAAAIRAELAESVSAFTSSAGRPPALSIVLVGDDPASHVYVRGKERAGQETGLNVVVHRLPATTELRTLLELVAALNADDGVDGILVQSPLPAAMGTGAAQHVFDAIDPAKDVDGFHAVNAGRLLQGRPALPPCTPSGVMELLDREGVAVAGQHAVVIGRSEIVGKPMALLLLQRDATVTICHSRTRDLPAVTRTGGHPGGRRRPPGFRDAADGSRRARWSSTSARRLSATARWSRSCSARAAPRLAAFDKKGSTVVGDVHPAVADVAGALSPVPGGVGPLTIAMLLKNTLTAARDKKCGRAGL